MACGMSIELACCPSLDISYRSTSVKDYLENLIESIISIFPPGINLKVEKNIDDFDLDPKRLIPVGIIVSEILTNTMKYAFYPV